MQNIDLQIKSMLRDFELGFGVPQTLDAYAKTRAVVIITGITERIKALYGADIPISHNITSDGAVIYVKGYAVFGADDFYSFLLEESGYLSASHLLDEVLMSFEPSKSRLLARLKDEGFQAVIDDYMPMVMQIEQVDTDINNENIPLPLLQAISKANVIYAFVCECLGLELRNERVSMTLTITDLVLNTIIKCDGRYYEINGINDIHSAILGFKPATDLDYISEGCITQMYEKLGVGYIPISE